MKVITAKMAGFCFGVKRAIDIAFDVAEKNKGGVCTLGPIIHNPQVVRELHEEGVESAGTLAELRRKKGVTAVIIRTHGIPEPDMQRLEAGGYRIIDATCPFVKKAQHYAKLLKDENYKVVILGDREHPEVKGLVSYAGRGVTVIRDADEYRPVKGRVGIVVQTTQQVEALKRLLLVAIEHAKELKVYNTICNSTALRLKETGEMAKKVDVMVIVGGKNSANTTQLANLSKSLGVSTYHIETEDELRDEWFSCGRTVGLTAGASTPDWIIKRVKDRLKYIGGRDCNGD